MAGQVWNINEDIIIDILITDPNTGLGLDGQVSYMNVKIRRASDNLYWNGTKWAAGVTELTPSESDSVNEPGRYVYILPGSTGNTSANKYYIYVGISNPPLIEGNDTEVHISRSTDLRVYEAEPA